MAGTRRRERRSPEFWRELVAAQPGSGRTVAQYCAARGVGPAGFYAWRKRWAAEEEAGRAPKRRARSAAPGFAAVRVTANAESAAPPRSGWAGAQGAGVEVVLPGGTVLRAPAGVEVEAFARLAAALRSAGC